MKEKIAIVKIPTLLPAVNPNNDWVAENLHGWWISPVKCSHWAGGVKFSYTSEEDFEQKKNILVSSAMEAVAIERRIMAL